ncbi:hypothetical protein BN10_600017 [Phycicoccus elongatus Lp2]|uniref:Uncharacterized protein n=1 Tax=Phycicoccus elongatus Lp2 TaxID=1193181 RepID=N0E5N4_9MICO|nr:hypothetical protein BN10_600017 [Phycicoccus elongatus Lp2]
MRARQLFRLAARAELVTWTVLLLGPPWTWSVQP